MQFWLQVCGGNPKSLKNCAALMADGVELDNGGFGALAAS
jgi:hypothetical protein